MGMLEELEKPKEELEERTAYEDIMDMKYDIKEIKLGVKILILFVILSGVANILFLILFKMVF